MPGPLLEQHAAILAQKLADGQLALFVGAGLSRQAIERDGSGRRLPLWKELAEQVARTCQEDLDAYGGNILDLFDAIELDQSRFTLEKAVSAALDDKAYEPSPAHRTLAELPWAAVYTTNYDGLLGQVLKADPVFEEEQYDRLQLSADKRPRLFHVHGTLAKPHTLTREDYLLWPEKHPRAYRDLEQVVLNKTVLFVGYSLSDPHLADGILPTVRKITARREKRLYAWMWQVPKNQAQLLDRRDKIEVLSIERDEDWAAAFQQVADALREVGRAPSAAIVAAAPDSFVYDRQQYLAAMQARYGAANLQGLYVTGTGYARDDILLGDVFVEPDLQVKAVVYTASASEEEGERGAADRPSAAARAIPASAPRRALQRHGRRQEHGAVVPADEFSLRAAVRERAKDENQERQWPRKEVTRRERSSQVIAREAKLLIVGAPGEGKSTLLRHALLEVAAVWRGQPAVHPFPAFVRLSEWEAEAGPCEGRLYSYLEGRLPKLGEISSKAIAKWLKGPVLWLLDGIDEIRDPGERIRLAEEVRTTSVLRPQDRWVVTTRPAGEPRGGLGAGWTRAVLPSLSESQVEQVLARWGAVLQKKEGLELDARQIARDLKWDPGLRQVRTNALLLTLAVLFFKNRKRLPQDRWEFYAAADTALSESWVRHRIERAERYLPGGYLTELLDRLALDGMRTGRVLFESAALKDAARTVLAERGYTGGEQDKEITLFLRAAADLIGVLVGQAPDRFGFLHLTFQEFYAARAISHQSEAARTRLIARHWDHPDWRDVWPLYALAVQNEPAKYDHLFSTILASGHALDRQLFRPQLACLRLTGLGSAPFPQAVEPVLDWMRDILKGTSYPLLQTMTALVGWERRLADDLHATLLARLGDDREVVRRAAAKVLAGAVGEAEVRAALLARLGDREVVRRAALLALARAVGEAEVQAALLAQLWDGSRSVRRAAAQALAGAVGEAEVQAALLARLGDADRDLRRAAAQALAGAVDEAEVRAALLARLADGHEVVREAAAQALAGAVGEAEVQAALLARLGDGHEVVREAAAQALAGAVGEAEVQAALLARLGDSSWSVRKAAAQALAGAVGEAEVQAALLARLGDSSWSVRQAAAQALAGAVGEAEVQAALLARLGDTDRDVRAAVVQALAGAVGEAEVQAALLARLGDREVVRRAALLALARAVDEAEVRAALLALLRASSWSVRRSAVGEAEVQAAPLVRVSDVDGDVREAAAQALAGAVDEAEVRAALLALLRDDLRSVRRVAAQALAGAVDEAEVRAALLERLGEGHEVVREAAAQALAGAVGEAEVQAALLERLGDGHEVVREAAAQALAAWVAAGKFGRRSGNVEVVQLH